MCRTFRNCRALLLGLLVLPLIDGVARANEMEEALSLQPDLENGKRIYHTCAVCHRPEGWGTVDGYYPQIAGQRHKVLIKQLEDIRNRHRDNPTMYPFTLPNILGGAQDIADVTGYVEQLPMAPFNGVGPGNDLEHGRKIYQEHCVDCHGKEGEGDEQDAIPALRGQHFNYLLRQFEWIRLGKRRNADAKMVRQVRDFSVRDTRAVMDYVSRLRPPPERIAPRGWLNPDFPHYARPAEMEPLMEPPPGM
ncbi:c-type cytochrome [Endothiovibrio diazotrophicus]